ncbi:PPE domain-containing protein [Actinokineospora iranica]|uniref:PPE family protein n=1 Tax=Actinokineospora iranica TaxID=1271860 RepID=A0A1G6YYI6_9PSEU|nr:PPE domain-containing protein [Actinokineospora iranica]SDD95418.1 PPE family protein [Actinokineospora iranica]
MPPRDPQTQHTPQPRTYEGTYESRLHDEAAQVIEDARGQGPFATLAALAQATPKLFAAGIDSQQYTATQQQALRDAGIDTRDAPPMPGTYYLGFEHPEMKKMLEDDMDPGQVDETGAEWNALGNSLIECKAAIAAGVGQSAEDWTGATGDNARGFLTGLGDWMEGTGQAFHLASNRMHAQSEASGAARAAMPEPVDFTMDDAMARLREEQDPARLQAAVDEVNQKFAEKQRAHEQAAEVMTTFSASLADSGTGMPVFAPVPTMASGTDDGTGRGVDSGPTETGHDGGPDRGRAGMPGSEPGRGDTSGPDGATRPAATATGPGGGPTTGQGGLVRCSRRAGQTWRGWVWRIRDRRAWVRRTRGRRAGTGHGRAWVRRVPGWSRRRRGRGGDRARRTWRRGGPGTTGRWARRRRGLRP